MLPPTPSSLLILPGLPWTASLGVQERFEIYSRYVWHARVWEDNAADAHRALSTGKKVVLGLRRPTSTAANKGKGLYDDRIVILQMGHGAAPRVWEFPANTEPSAQYDAGAGQAKFPALAGVVLKKVDGRDVNRDGMRDLGRLRPGIYRFKNNPSTSPIFLGSFGIDASRMTASARRAVERDIHHTGTFGAGATSLDRLNSSFLIHKGGDKNTWSAGCQTIPQVTLAAPDYRPERNPWATFTAMMWPQKGFYYVLVDTSKVLA